MIEVEGLTKYYGKHLGIKDISFHADRGEILGFLGPNAAGKTTTMRILTAYMPPSQGSAKIAGFDVVEDSLEVRCRVGYLPETIPLYSEMSVREYLSYMGSLRKVDKLENRIEEVFEAVHLVERGDSYISTLSKGLRQRVGLAQAILHQPEVLILDEPTIGLDPAQIIEVRHLIQELGEHCTILLSTHILTEAQQICDRVLIINNGEMIAEDTPENLQAQIAGADQVTLRANCEWKTLLELLESIQGVTDVRKGVIEGEVEIISTPGKDIRPELARAVVSAGIDLLELHSNAVSLEQIFLQLTREENAPEEAE
ncbi:MAG: ATP-binding cassette domain-containing protein [Anaerolineales bacterium]|nr:ATP-binding cassette domain-containing protein [Anaerolineales bacterium]